MRKKIIFTMFVMAISCTYAGFGKGNKAMNKAMNKASDAEKENSKKKVKNTVNQLRDSF